MAEFYQYVPERIVAQLGGIPLKGFADGTMITVAFDEDAVTKTAGGQGTITATVNGNRSGRVTFSLVQGSTTNDELCAIAASVRPRGAPLIVLPFILEDLNGTSFASGDSAWVVKVPDNAFSKEAGAREWMIDIAELQVNVGGAVK